LKAKGFEIVFSCGNEACLSGDNSFYRLSATVDDNQVNYRYAKGVRYLLARLSRPQGDVFAGVMVGDSSTPIVKVTAVELKPIEMGKIAFIDASAMEKAIAASGRVALYGIQFDTDKTDIKPESAPTLAEIAKFLKASPSISLIVTGHTDNQGAFDYNVDLSRRRAAAVIAHLVKNGGVAQARLTPFGAGMAAPVAVNDDEAGRAKNRRVELVKR
jgi:OOP family OmpA-OmpF porin